MRAAVMDTVARQRTPGSEPDEQDHDRHGRAHKPRDKAATRVPLRKGGKTLSETEQELRLPSNNCQMHEELGSEQRSATVHVAHGVKWRLVGSRINTDR